MDVAAKLQAIAQELREHPERHTKGIAAMAADGSKLIWAREYRTRGVCFCSLGFIWRDTVNDENTAIAMERALERAVGDEWDAGPKCRVANWNDHPDRTAAEVADAFERAAALAKDAPHA